MIGMILYCTVTSSSAFILLKITAMSMPSPQCAQNPISLIFSTAGSPHAMQEPFFPFSIFTIMSLFRIKMERERGNPIPQSIESPQPVDKIPPEQQGV
jgi:hypothetical protein